MDPHLVAQVFVMIGVWWSLLLMGMCCWVLFSESISLPSLTSLGVQGRRVFFGWADRSSSFLYRV